MKRREFLKHSGAGALALIGGPRLWAGTSTNETAGTSLFLEAEHFSEKGGWKVDSQFMDELGFSYLLAHGLGEPVANARANAVFPQPGQYHLWVRTKNWVPGEWDPPGRFEVLVNGEAVDTVFGTKPGWAWQEAGPITIENPEATVELRDLTGFDGRCDALYFSMDGNDVPPNDTASLPRWRRQKLGRPDVPQETHNFDVVIVGGGITGCAAALAAESKGLQVALIQDRPVLGGNASSEIRVHTIGIRGKRDDILKKIDTPHYPNGSPKAKKAEKKRHEAMNAAKGIHQFLGHSVYGVEKDGKQIESVEAIEVESGITRRFKAPNFIDCTGDGWLGFWAGVAYRYGRESRYEFDEGWDRHGELWSPQKPDNWVMGSSVLWRSENIDRRAPFPDVPWAMPVAKEHNAVSGEWYWEYSDNEVHQIHDAEHVRDHMLRAIYGSFANSKKHPKNARRKLTWVSHLIGKRESRRLMGDYIYTMNDALENRDFPDTVVTEKREVDVHYQRVRRGHPVDFLAKAMFRKPKKEYYHVPFRCLYAKDMDNLMMAGRCFSCSHIGLGGPRVMRTCGQMGVAVGFASVLCREHNKTPREVGQEHIAELRNLCGYS